MTAAGLRRGDLEYKHCLVAVHGDRRNAQSFETDADVGMSALPASKRSKSR